MFGSAKRANDLYKSYGALSTLATQMAYDIKQPKYKENMRKNFIEEFFYLLDNGSELTLDSTCSTSNDCTSDNLISRCCASIDIRSNSTGEHD